MYIRATLDLLDATLQESKRTILCNGPPSSWCDFLGADLLRVAVVPNQRFFYWTPGKNLRAQYYYVTESFGVEWWKG